ncbi:MAG: polyprenyl synthetase family protein [Acidothermus sp.]|nr:polyprenyl synthetase family protein [Acidothermus sp.]
MDAHFEPPVALGAARELVEPSLRAAVDRLDPKVRRVAAYHFGWEERDGSPGRGGGKAVRPALAVLSARAVGADGTVGVPGGVAVELVHNFSLLHDDVMDGDEERRHRPTAWTVFGRSAAILAGDALLALAFDVLLDADRGRDAQSCLASATQELIVGQVYDLEFENRLDVGLTECIAMAGAKTAALMACAASIGARLAGAGPAQIEALETFGRELGLAFQLVDDILGIWGSPEVTGKPVGADLRARKKSLPVVAAMSSETTAGAELRALYAGEKLHTDADPQVVARAAALVEEAGGRRWATDEAARRLAVARTAIANAGLDSSATRDLLALADYVTQRDH